MIKILLISVIFHYQLNFSIPKISIQKGSEVVLSVKGCFLHGDPGKPLLPVKTVFVVADSVKVTYKTKFLQGTYNILPAERAVPITRPEMFKPTTRDSTVYNSSSIFPQRPYRILGERHILGVKVQELLLYPISYQPLKGIVSFNYQFQIKPLGEKQLVTPTQFKILRNLLINPDYLKVKFGSAEKYIIITSNTLAPYFQPLVEWKRRKGILAGIYTTSYIYSSFGGRDNAEKIRNFIKTMADSGVIYVLLGGDTDIIPARYAYAMDAGTGNPSDDSLPADLYYSDLDGSWDANNNNIFGEVGDSVDLLPDVVIGRAPVSTSGEVTNFVTKVINYERYHQANYFTNVLFIASYLDDQTDGGIHKDLVASWIPPDVSIQRLYERDGNLTRATALYYINRGANIINHDGHGAWYLMQVGGDYLNPEDFDQLINSPYITGIFYSLGCWTCAIDYDCIGEHFVKSQNGGGFYIGNSRYGWYIPGFPGFSSSDQFDIQFFKNLYHTSPVTGVALALTKAEFAPLSTEENDYRWSEYVLTYLGDPEMSVFTHTPESLHTNLSGDIHYGLNSLRIRITDIHDNPVRGAKVTLLQDDSLIVTEETGVDGFLNLNFNIPSYDSVLLTVYKPGYYYDEFHYQVYSPSRFPILSSYGNKNFNIYFADSSVDTLFMIFKNTGDSTTIPETLSVNTINPVATTVSEIVIPVISPGDSAIINIPITVYPVTADTQSEIILTGDTTYTMSVVIFKTRLKLVNYQYSNVRAGESGVLHLILKNTLPVKINDYHLPIQSLDNRLILRDTTFNITNLDSGDSIAIQIPFTTSFSGDTLYFARIETGNDTIYISIGYSGYRFSFENSIEGWIVQNDHWHVTNYRASDGSYSIYVGNDANHRYQPNFTASIQSPDLIISDSPTLSFETYYETQPGWDFCIVEMLYRDSTFHIATFSGPSSGWENYSYKLDNLHPGDTIRIRFTFYSEDNDVQLEGWYIDNVELGRNSVPTSVREKKNQQITESIVIKGNILKLGSPGKYFLFDISGKAVRRSVQNILNLHGLPSGLYFVVEKNSPNSYRTIRRILLLR